MVYTKMVIVDLNKFIKFVQHSYCSDIHKHSEAWIDVFQLEGCELPRPLGLGSSHAIKWS